MQDYIPDGTWLEKENCQDSERLQQRMKALEHEIKSLLPDGARKRNLLEMIATLGASAQAALQAR